MSGTQNDFVGPQGVEVPRADRDPVSAAINLQDGQTIQMVRSALENRRLRLAYQPVVLARKPSQPIFYEGLIRVLDPTGRVIPARDFISTVESLDIGRLIDCAALELGLAVLLRHPNIRLSINMSARSIGYPRWVAILKRGLNAGPTVGERLILEINEASLNLVPELVAEFMESLQPEGVCFAIDGFGAGMTAMRHFRDFYFDIIKIDGQFIRGIAASPDNQLLVASMVMLAQHFDLMTVAESVESQSELDVLARLGVDGLQGYHTGAPSVRPTFLEEGRQEKPGPVGKLKPLILR